MNRENSSARLVIFVFIGLLFGGVIGEVFGAVLGQIGVISGGGIDNPVRNFFVTSFEFGFGINESNGVYSSDVLDLYLLKIPLGIAIKLNLCSFLGMAGSLYIMKWSK